MGCSNYFAGIPSFLCLILFKMIFLLNMLNSELAKQCLTNLRYKKPSQFED